ncbi:MAG TPA: non-heme iron oxygenase ferredoxin subunit [Nitrospiraceae bacterium]|nr:non-heme iron oxygenase ferredoxin subunit [Nitrospiraceae bacterium]
MSEFVRVAGTDDVKPGSGMVVDVKDKTIAVFNIEGTYHAIDNTCVHRGGPLGEGDVEGGVVTCPWHGWQFNIATGACLNNPAAKVTSYQVQIEGSDIKVLL